jgi:hypothetical protein
MQLIDSTAVGVYLAFAGLAVTVGFVVLLAVLPLVLRHTRLDRLGRRESIPAYYGRLHFAH